MLAIRRPIQVFSLVLVAVAMLVAGCGGGDDGGGGGGGGGGAEGQAEIENAKTIDTGQLQNPSGDVTFCIGGSLEGWRQVVSSFNEQGNVNADIVELSESADEQRRQQIQRLQAQSKECDVLAMDVIWTAEYASQGWVYDISPLMEQDRDKFIPSTVESATYQDRVWAMPANSNAGFIYYMTDAVEGGQAPGTWQDVYERAKATDGIVYQGARYEGLTVNFLELLYSAGGQVINDEGTEATVDTQEARDVLNFMREGITSGAAPEAVTTMKEEQARRAFETGRASFMRNWPYAYALGQESDIKGDFEVAPFPAFRDGDPAGVLGGYNLGINAFTDNVGGAAAFVQHVANAESQKTFAVEASLPPVVGEVYDDPEVKEAMPFAQELRQSIQQAKPRPVSPVYPQISQAIYTNVHQALTGRTPVDQAVKQMQSEIQKALETF